MSDLDFSKYKMSNGPCPNCGCVYGEIRQNGPHYEALCCDCGRHRQFVSKSELGIAQRRVKTREAMRPKDRTRVLLRANGACEVCHSTDSPLTIGHLLSVKAAKEMGLSEDDYNSDENLAAMCEACNLGLGSEPVPLKFVFQLLTARLRLKNPELMNDPHETGDTGEPNRTRFQ